MSGTTADLMYEVLDEVDAATSANDLASRLSPYYTASLSMEFPDADALQLAVSIAQDSWDEWSPDDGYAATEQSEITWLNQCELGNLENEYYDNGESQFLCQDSEWRAVKGWPRRSRPLFRNAAFHPTMWTENARLLAAPGAFGAQGYYCSVPASERGKYIVRVDAGVVIGAGIGQAFWGIFGGPFGFVAWAVAGAGVGSYSAYKLMAWNTRAC